MPSAIAHFASTFSFSSTICSSLCHLTLVSDFTLPAGYGLRVCACVCEIVICGRLQVKQALTSSHKLSTAYDVVLQSIGFDYNGSGGRRALQRAKLAKFDQFDRRTKRDNAGPVSAQRTVCCGILVSSDRDISLVVCLAFHVFHAVAFLSVQRGRHLRCSNVWIYSVVGWRARCWSRCSWQADGR